MIVKLSGQKIRVEFIVPNWNGTTDKMGTSCMKDGVVQINRLMPHDQQMQTLMHEIIHQIADMNALSGCDNETTVACLANALMGFLRDNPAIARKICNL